MKTKVTEKKKILAKNGIDLKLKKNFQQSNFQNKITRLCLDLRQERQVAETKKKNERLKKLEEKDG